LDTAINWGIVPDHSDIDIVYSVMFAHEWVLATHKEYGNCELYTDETLDIPETGEFGTADIIFVKKDLIHVIDYKNGYVPVDINLNAQLMCYLLGAIAKYGERRHYKISVIQPNYVHVDGKIRHYDVTPEKLQWFRNEVAFSMLNSEKYVAGKHCKTTYCPHRGSCEVFNAWAKENLQLAYYPSDVAGMNDDELAEALDQADILQGWRDTLRGEALRRILHQNRSIKGYKIVRGKKDRDFRDDKHREQVFTNLKELGATTDELYTPVPISVAGVERVIKRIFKPQGRNAWATGMDKICGPDMLAPQNLSLTLEKAIDGRKPYSRGAEFGPLKGSPEDATTDTSNTSNTSNTMKDIL